MSQEAVHLITDLFQNNTYDMTGCLIAPIHCSNNGVCKFNELTKTHNCECLNHFTGTKCETNLNKCSSYPCLNNACMDDHVVQLLISISGTNHILWFFSTNLRFFKFIIVNN